MTELRVKTKGDARPDGKPRVYFTCHPADFERSLERLCADLFMFSDCAVYFTPNMEDRLPEDTRETDMERMNLFVIPVSLKLLLESNRAMDEDFPFAMEKHIPVLPILLEPGLDQIYSRKDKFGELQYLAPASCDPTAIPYAEKLKKYLDSILVDSETLKLIQAAFDAYIFLSYRKKDRRLANELLHIIHADPQCRDLAIWFDEFLAPGESFTDAIREAMMRSKAFALLVTPSLLEPNDQGEPNYVQTTEYPEARKLAENREMDTLPAEFLEAGGKPTDREVLFRDFADLPEPLNLRTEEERERFLARLRWLAIKERREDPVHNYLIGLAYLEGIDVERNAVRAVELITDSADQGCFLALKQLTFMYENGYGVPRDADKALTLYEEQIKLLSGGDDRRELEALCAHTQLILEVDAFIFVNHRNQIKQNTVRAFEIINVGDWDTRTQFRTFSLLALANEKCGFTGDYIIELSLNLIPKVADDNEEICAAKAFFLHRLAESIYHNNAGMLVYEFYNNETHKRKQEEAKRYALTALELLSGLYENDRFQWKYAYADALLSLCSMNFIGEFLPLVELIRYSEVAIGLFQELNEDNDFCYAPKLAEFCMGFGEALVIEKDIIWEEFKGNILNLEGEKDFPNAPEQLVPLDIGSWAYDEPLDIRRLRKALLMMRYGVSLFERAVERGADGLLFYLGHAYESLVRLLYMFSSWIETDEVPDIQETHILLLKDGYRCSRKMLRVMTLGVAKARKSGISVRLARKADWEISRDLKEEPSEGVYVELESAAYHQASFSDSYNIAVELADYAPDESTQLHEDLRVFFRDVCPDAEPELILLNICACADRKDSPKEKLSCLLEFEEVSPKAEDETPRGCRPSSLHSYYRRIAQCYFSLEDYVHADLYLEKAIINTSRGTSEEYPLDCCIRAECQRRIGNLNKAEKLVLEGLESLIATFAPDEYAWNKLCREYADILLQMNRSEESRDWLRQMLPLE